MEQRKQALVVHDDPDVIDMVRQALQQKGYQILTARNGLEGYRLFTSNLVSLVILDIMMPGRDGYSLCRDLRAISSVPIILVTDRQNEDDVRRGMDLGADDVMRVPFDTPQFLVSLQGVLSLTAERQEYNFQSREVRIGILCLDRDNRVASRDSAPLALSPIEYALLSYLMSNAGSLFDRDTLLTEVWGNKPGGPTNVVDVTIRRLREKIEPEPSRPVYLLTVRGHGYRFAAADEVNGSAVASAGNGERETSDIRSL